MTQPAALVVKQYSVQAVHTPLADVPLAARKAMCRAMWEMQEAQTCSI